MRAPLTLELFLLLLAVPLIMAAVCLYALWIIALGLAGIAMAGLRGLDRMLREDVPDHE